MLLLLHIVSARLAQQNKLITQLRLRQACEITQSGQNFHSVECGAEDAEDLFCLHTHSDD